MPILVGTASWTDKSLIDSGWYPSGVTSAEDRPHYYATRFPLVEVDSTYYFLPSEANGRRWAERTPKGFTFDVKAFSLFTGHPTARRAIPRDLSVPDGHERVYRRHLHPRTVDAIWSRFLGGLEPLRAAGKLGAVLFQFPPWFTLKRANKEYLLTCVERVKPVRACVEFRHASWMSEENRGETVDFLTGHDVPYVCVDMPQSTASSVPPVALATAGDLAVVRLHGRAKGRTREAGPESAAYRYRPAELDSWAGRADDLASRADTVHIVFRNAYRDYAVRNAASMMTKLGHVTQPSTAAHDR